jgi:hypothetical protein
MPPARSWVSAGTTRSAHTSPRVSTATNRLRPASFFPPVVPVRAAVLGPLDRLAVEDRDRRPGPLPGGPADLGPQAVVELAPGAVLLPGAEVMEDDPVGRQVVGQGAPDAPVAGLVQHAVDDLAAGVAGRPAARPGGRHEALDPPPLGVRQVGGVRCPAHPVRLQLPGY